MVYENLRSQIKSLILDPTSEYSLFEYSNYSFCGLDFNHNLVFVSYTNDLSRPSYFQETKEIKLGINVHCKFVVKGVSCEKECNVLTCLSTDVFQQEAFLRLGAVFFEDKKSTSDIIKLFSSLTNMFGKAQETSLNEIQGFYGELYTIYYFSLYNLNLSRFWQSQEKMKFDFSLNEIKRIEVKTTCKEERIHRFRHEQLISDLFDIKIISLLLRKADNSLSLGELIKRIQNLPDISFSVLSNIESFLNKSSNRSFVLNVSFDELYTKENLKIYSANDVPKFNSKQPNGVSNTEYDSDLSLVKTIDIPEFTQWINCI